MENPYTILVQVDRAARLFNSLDPTPFRERDLDREAERFIVEWAQEAPSNAMLEIVIQLTGEEAGTAAIETLQQALCYNFQDRAAQAYREVRELLREGRRALVIGIPVLALSIVASQIISNLAGPAAPAKVISESLLIFGWVANWRPLEIFLYGWWEIARRRRLYQRLAAANVRVVSITADR
ncbi:MULTISPECIES: hypothetical protein [Rhizobium]|uniref:Uncharacterized protein n=1 Tax=Rhizobium paranaense TaxID=1650438 RepID=A0A7W9D2Z7_9HYPH|nr:hypothetical protein [Rhizobium paranaense]MBB5575914.1 hypothetical protein [Rhizobium paranaense]